MTEQNKAMALRWSEELWSRGHLEVADEIVAPDYVRHDPGDPFPAHGPGDVKRIVGMLRSMLPDRIPYKVFERSAGVGSLGRRRFVAIAEWTGGLIAREAKALVPSAAVWAGLTVKSGTGPAAVITSRSL